MAIIGNPQNTYDIEKVMAENLVNKRLLPI